MITIFFIVNIVAFLIGVFGKKPFKFISPKAIYGTLRQFFRK